MLPGVFTDIPGTCSPPHYWPLSPPQDFPGGPRGRPCRWDSLLAGVREGLFFFKLYFKERQKNNTKVGKSIIVWWKPLIMREGSLVFIYLVCKFDILFKVNDSWRRWIALIWSLIKFVKLKAMTKMYTILFIYYVFFVKN